jgi:hypothetical protein
VNNGLCRRAEEIAMVHRLGCELGNFVKIIILPIFIPFCILFTGVLKEQSDIVIVTLKF